MISQKVLLIIFEREFYDNHRVQTLALSVSDLYFSHSFYLIVDSM